jgi:hypothetical protein
MPVAGVNDRMGTSRPLTPIHFHSSEARAL